jgi:hypothetical protein
MAMDSRRKPRLRTREFDCVIRRLARSGPGGGWAFLRCSFRGRSSGLFILGDSGFDTRRDLASLSAGRPFRPRLGLPESLAAAAANASARMNNIAKTA